MTKGTGASNWAPVPLDALPFVVDNNGSRSNLDMLYGFQILHVVLGFFAGIDDYRVFVYALEFVDQGGVRWTSVVFVLVVADQSGLKPPCDVHCTPGDVGELRRNAGRRLRGLLGFLPQMLASYEQRFTPGAL